jgi:hypothetical protein
MFTRKRTGTAVPAAALILMMLVYIWPAAADELCGVESKFKDGKCEKLFKYQIHQDLPQHLFRVVWTPDPVVELDRIEVSTTENITVFQKLTVDECFAPFLSFEAADMNFDGYDDLMFLVGAGASGNESYMVWFYDKDKANFDPRKEFIELPSPSPDPETRSINTHARLGMVGLNYVSTAHQYIDGKLTPVETERQQDLYPSQYFLNVVSRRSDGKMEVVKEEIWHYPDLQDGKLVCGPEKPPRSCGPMAAVILFTYAERDLDAKKMVGHYADTVTWNGESRTRDWLQSNHADYLDKIKEYEIEMDGFETIFHPSAAKAVVKCNVKGSFTDRAGASRSFHIRKRFGLDRQGDTWKIGCEEVAGYLDEKKAQTFSHCVPYR